MKRFMLTGMLFTNVEIQHHSESEFAPPWNKIQQEKSKFRTIPLIFPLNNLVDDLRNLLPLLQFQTVTCTLFSNTVTN